MHKIYVIIPIYNVELYIKRCVESILLQSYKDYVLVLVDDGSPDDCGIICDEYAKQFDFIHVIHKDNGGLSSARNAGLEYAISHRNCKWITFIDSDDWVHPQYLEFLYRAIHESNARIAACKYMIVNDKLLSTNLFASSYKTETLNIEEFFCSNSGVAVIACAKLFHISCFYFVRFPNGKLHEDEYTTYKVLFSESKIAYIDQELYYYYCNENSITRSDWTPRQLDYFEAVSEQINYFWANNFRKALHNAVFWYAHFLHKQMETIKEQPEYKKYRQKMRLMFQRHLLKFGRKHLPFHENYNYYEDAFPHIMTIYWNYKGIKSKLKRNN